MQRPFWYLPYNTKQEYGCRAISIHTFRLFVEIMSDAFGKKMHDKHTIKYEILSVNSPIQVVGFLSDVRRID
jgi:hypothetical protein